MPSPTYSVEIDYFGTTYRWAGVSEESVQWLRVVARSDFGLKEITHRLGPPIYSYRPAPKVPPLAIAVETTKGVPIDAECDRVPPPTCVNQRFGNDVVAVKIAASEWPALRAWMKRRGLVDTNDVWAPWPECKVTVPRPVFAPTFPCPYQEIHAKDCDCGGSGGPR